MKIYGIARAAQALAPRVALSFLIKSIELHNYSTNRKRHSTARSGILFCAL